MDMSGTYLESCPDWMLWLLNREVAAVVWLCDKMGSEVTITEGTPLDNIYGGQIFPHTHNTAEAQVEHGQKGEKCFPLSVVVQGI